MVIPTFPDFVIYYSVFVVRVRGALWLVDMPDYEVTVRDPRAFPVCVTPSVCVAPWPDVDLAQVSSSLDERILEARFVAMRRTARLFAEISEVPQFWVAIRSKDWISTGTEVGLSLLEAVIKKHLDLRVLEDNHDQSDRRHLQSRDTVAVLCETIFEDWSNLGCRIIKGFLKSILQRFIGHDQVDVSNLAGLKQIFLHIIQVEHDVWKNPKHRGYSSLEFVLNQINAMTETAIAAIFRLGYVQTQRRAATVLVNAWQHCADLDTKIMRQSERGHKRKVVPLWCCNDVVKVDGCAQRRLSSRFYEVLHWEHGGPFPLPPS